jgi:hypothetical protein
MIPHCNHKTMATFLCFDGYLNDAHAAGEEDFVADDIGSEWWIALR